jgi:hypothetical protein
MYGGQIWPHLSAILQFVKLTYAKLTPRPEQHPMRQFEATDLVEVSSMQFDGTSVACQFLAESGTRTSSRKPITMIGAT